ncbi:MAG: hypothetical protein JXP34_01235 [Planctomycetes bacterium]|nr:hypothetical protein [Planctomycetota bacterium]
MKCPHCGQRKGKRRCPLILADICPSCCAEVRAVPDRCPRDCPFFISSGQYQARRRKEKQTAHGAPYVEERKTVFPDEGDLLAAAEIEHIIYLWERRRGRMTDEEVARAYERLAGLLGPIAVVGETIPPVVSLLHQAIDRFPRCSKTPSARLPEICRGLARLARAGGAEDSPRDYLDRLADYHQYVDWTPVEIPPAAPGTRGSGGSGSMIILPS